MSASHDGHRLDPDDGWGMGAPPAIKPNRWPGPSTHCLSCRQGRHGDCHREHCKCPHEEESSNGG